MRELILSLALTVSLVPTAARAPREHHHDDR